jgi:hypothetical protein
MYITILVTKMCCSFTVRDQDGRDIGVALNFDANAEPEMEIDTKLSIVLEFLESLEKPIK